MAVKKRLHDMRGRQANMLRLAAFDIEALVHMLFYRLLVFFGIVYGAAMLLSFAYAPLGGLIKPLTVLVWILFTPQIYETAKVFALTSSGGLAFGRFNKEHVYVMKAKYGKSSSFLLLIPYVTLLLWAAGFLAMLAWWNL